MDAIPAASACDAGYLVRPIRGGRYSSGDLFDRGPALTEKDFQRRRRKFIPGTMFQGVQPIQ